MTETPTAAERASYTAWRYAKPRPADFRGAGLEVLHHHYTHGAVWDGNQISKQERDRFVAAGMLSRVDGSGYHALTRHGSLVARRTRPAWLLREAVARIRWPWLRRRLLRAADSLENLLTPPPPPSCERHIP